MVHRREPFFLSYRNGGGRELLSGLYFFTSLFSSFFFCIPLLALLPHRNITHTANEKEKQKNISIDIKSWSWRDWRRLAYSDRTTTVTTEVHSVYIYNRDTPFYTDGECKRRKEQKQPSKKRKEMRKEPFLVEDLPYFYGVLRVHTSIINTRA